MLVFNLSSYEFYLSDDSVSEMTAQSLVTWLQTIASERATPLGGRSWPQRIRRMFYDITFNIYEMFRHQPILTVCLFGVPLAFFSIITYSICSADFSVDRDEVYPPDSLQRDSYGENDTEESSDAGASQRSATAYIGFFQRRITRRRNDHLRIYASTTVAFKPKPSNDLSCDAIVFSLLVSFATSFIVLFIFLCSSTENGCMRHFTPV